MKQRMLTITIILALSLLIAGNGFGEQESANDTNQLICKLNQPAKYSAHIYDSKPMHEPIKKPLIKAAQIKDEKQQTYQVMTVKNSSGFGLGGYQYTNDRNSKEICKIDPGTFKVVGNYNSRSSYPSCDCSSVSMMLVHWNW